MARAVGSGELGRASPWWVGGSCMDAIAPGRAECGGLLLRHLGKGTGDRSWSLGLELGEEHSMGVGRDAQGA